MQAHLSQPPPFNLASSDLANEWALWTDGYVSYEISSGVNKESEEIRKHTFLHCIGQPARRVFNNLQGSKDTFEECKKLLTDYFDPKRNTVAERYKFRSRGQSDTETIDEYTTVLRELTKSCCFKELEDQMIRDQIVEKCKSSHLREKLLQVEDLTLEKALRTGRLYEKAQVESKAMNPVNPPTLSNLNPVNRVKYQKKVPEHRQQTPGTAQYEECYRCGKWNHDPDSCGACNAACSFCGVVGHYARVCRKKKSQQQSGKKKSYPHKHHKVRNVEEDSDSDHEFVWMVDSKCSQTININNQYLKMVVDTGCESNIISELTYRTLFHQYPLVQTARTFSAYGGNKLKCKGYFLANLQWNGHIQKDRIYVMFGQSEPLIGRKSSFDLEIIKPNFVNKVAESESMDFGKIMEEYSDIFQGLGHIKKADGQPYQHSVTVDPTVTPVAQRLRRKPFAMEEAINAEIRKMEEDDIIEKTTGGSKWISNLIAVPKNSSNEVRVCCDLREVNKAVVREPYPSPRVEDILAKLTGAKTFAKLDVRKAFWQIELEPESKTLTTFITSKGTYQYKRVPFGLSSASDVFQSVIDDVIRDIPGVISECDDMILYAANNKELLDIILQVFQRCRERGVKLNRDKVQLGLSSIEVVGHHIGEDGVRPAKSKVEAIIHAPRPGNLSELRSFLGTCGYVQKFINDYANICEPLRKLTRKDVSWNWGEEQENAFSALKEAISRRPCLAYYKLGAPTVVITDASPVGLGAILMQEQADGTNLPVAYASRSLTETERRYSQIEKEALGCVWAVEYFRNYLWGVRFKLLTDHRPLIYMFNPRNSTIVPPRIQGLLWRLLGYDYHIGHIPGKMNIADSLSRMPLMFLTGEVNTNVDMVDENICGIIEQNLCNLNAITINELKVASREDPIIVKLHDYICSGTEWPKKNLSADIEPYYKYKDELSTYDSFVLRGNRIVVPVELRKRVLQLAHETHQGIVRTKQFLRMRFFWPGLDHEVEDMVSRCPLCVINQPLIHDSPLHTSELPDKVWQKVSMDIFGPINGQYLLTMMDYFSSWPEAMFLNDISSDSVIEKLSEVFGRSGFPDVIITDNGQQFIGTKTEAFLKRVELSMFDLVLIIQGVMVKWRDSIDISKSV